MRARRRSAAAAGRPQPSQWITLKIPRHRPLYNNQPPREGVVSHIVRNGHRLRSLSQRRRPRVHPRCPQTRVTHCRPWRHCRSWTRSTRRARLATPPPVPPHHRDLPRDWVSINSPRVTTTSPPPRRLCVLSSSGVHRIFPQDFLNFVDASAG